MDLSKWTVPASFAYERSVVDSPAPAPAPAAEIKTNTEQPRSRGGLKGQSVALIVVSVLLGTVLIAGAGFAFWTKRGSARVVVT